MDSNQCQKVLGVLMELAPDGVVQARLAREFNAAYRVGNRTLTKFCVKELARLTKVRA
jgi:hypothetical protein